LAASISILKFLVLKPIRLATRTVMVFTPKVAWARGSPEISPVSELIEIPGMPVPVMLQNRGSVAPAVTSTVTGVNAAPISTVPISALAVGLLITGATGAVYVDV
jgi:hypothetical protein